MKISLLLFCSVFCFNLASFAQDADSTGNFTGNYFFSGSAKTLEQSHSMIVWNLWGPEYTYGITSNFQVGGLASWIASPIAFKADLSTSISETFNISVAGFYGVDWATSPSEPGGGLNAKFTFGDNRKNISATVYGFNLTGEGFGQVYSISTYLKRSEKSALIVESFLFEVSDEIGGAIIPGIQHRTKRDRFLHAGFIVFFYNETILPLPIPFLQLHVPIN